jgi:hypothetical protein
MCKHERVRGEYSRAASSFVVHADKEGRQRFCAGVHKKRLAQQQQQHSAHNCERERESARSWRLEGNSRKQGIGGSERVHHSGCTSNALPRSAKLLCHAMPCHAMPCRATPYRFQLSAILNFLTNLSAVPPTLLAYGGGGERLEVDKNARGSRREGGNTCSSHCGKREEQEG